jgi:hypothetical protein
MLPAHPAISLEQNFVEQHISTLSFLEGEKAWKSPDRCEVWVSSNNTGGIPPISAGMVRDVSLPEDGCSRGMTVTAASGAGAATQKDQLQ